MRFQHWLGLSEALGSQGVSTGAKAWARAGRPRTLRLAKGTVEPEDHSLGSTTCRVPIDSIIPSCPLARTRCEARHRNAKHRSPVV
jgi:hypothetical protein